MLDNPKILLALIITTLTASGFLAFQMVGKGYSSLAFDVSSQTGTLLDKFENQPSSTIEKGSSTSKHTLINVSLGTAVSPANGSRNGAVLFYDRASGNLKEYYAPDHTLKNISATKLPGFMQAIWSPDRASAISLFSTSGGYEYRYHNYRTGHTLNLPANVRSIAYSPNSSQIIYFATTGENGGIYLAQSDGSNPKKVLETRISDLDLFWPTQDSMYFIAKNTTSGTWDLTRVTESGALENILTDLLGLRVSWSRDGSALLYSHHNKSGSVYLEYLYLDGTTKLGGSLVPLATTANHCTWGIDAKTIYCGVPSSTLSPEDILTEKPHPEIISKFHVGDSAAKEVYSGLRGDTGVSIQSPFLSPLENYLFFLNSLDSKVYGVSL